MMTDMKLISIIILHNAASNWRKVMQRTLVFTLIALFTCAGMVAINLL